MGCAACGITVVPKQQSLVSDHAILFLLFLLCSIERLLAFDIKSGPYCSFCDAMSLYDAM